MRELLLHLAVLTLFVEGVAYGPVSTGRVMAVALLVAAVFALATHPRRPVVPHVLVVVPAVLLTAWTLLSGMWAADQGAWQEVVLELALALCYFAGFVVLTDSRAWLRRLLVTFVAGATVVAVLGIAQAAWGVRAVGLQGDPNTYAMYQLCAVPIAVMLAGRRSGAPRVGWLLVTLVLLGSVLASQSRGGLLAAMVVLGYLLWSGDAGRLMGRWRHFGPVAGTAMLAGLVYVVTRVPRYDVQAVLESGGTGRRDIWRAAWLAWEERPLLGLGAGGFEPRSGRLLSRISDAQVDPNSVLFEGIRVHNAYLEPWVELGPVGFLLFVGLMLAVVVLLWQDRTARSDDLVAATVPMFLAFASASIFLSTMNNKVLWILAAWAAVLPFLREGNWDGDPAAATTTTTEVSVT